MQVNTICKLPSGSHAKHFPAASVAAPSRHLSPILGVGEHSLAADLLAQRFRLVLKIVVRRRLQEALDRPLQVQRLLSIEWRIVDAEVPQLVRQLHSGDANAKAGTESQVSSPRTTAPAERAEEENAHAHTHTRKNSTDTAHLRRSC